MKTIPKFRSSIPRNARERIVSWHASGLKAVVEYFVRRKLVGRRHFDYQGHLELDYSLRDGKRHGTTYRLDTPGTLLSATPYSRGIEHGVARQLNAHGTSRAVSGAASRSTSSPASGSPAACTSGRPLQTPRCRHFGRTRTGRAEVPSGHRAAPRRSPTGVIRIPTSGQALARQPQCRVSR